VNKIDGKVIWSIGASIFVLSLIPYLSTFVAENFYSFVAQACYGIDFIVVALLSIVSAKALKNVDKGNVALLYGFSIINNIFQPLLLWALEWL
jgi:hypothetical protein